MAHTEIIWRRQDYEMVPFLGCLHVTNNMFAGHKQGKVLIIIAVFFMRGKNASVIQNKVFPPARNQV